MRTLLIAMIMFLFCGISLAQTDLTGLSFCLDPGHGEYPNDKPYETRINLRVANYLKAYLEQYGATVILTRQDSTANLSLSQREYIANSNNVDFFHSIHHNAFQGTANYTLMLFEEKYNGQPAWPGESDFMSQIMGRKIHDYLYTSTYYARGDRSFLGFNLGVLNDLIMPGVLSEASFWDYVPEIHRLNCRDYLKLEAFACLHAFLEYYEVPKRPDSFLEGAVRDNENNLLSNIQVTVNASGYEAEYVTDSNNIGVTDEDNSWSGFPYTTEIHNGMYFFENVPEGEVQLIFQGENVIGDTIEVAVEDSTATRAGIILVSTAPPTVEFTYPTPGIRQRVRVNSSLAFDFNKPIDTESVIRAFSIEPAPDSVWFKFLYDDKKVRVYHEPDFAYWTEYTVTFKGDVLRDKWGFNLDGDLDGNPGGDFVATFRTRSLDETAPKLLQTYPTDAAESIPLETAVYFHFDEPLDTLRLNSNTIRLLEQEKAVPAQISWINLEEESFLFLTPDSLLKVNTTYRVNLSGEIADIYENAIGTDISFTFSTITGNPQITVLENFENGVDNWWDPDGSGSTTGTVPASTTFNSAATSFSLLPGQKSARLDYAWDVSAPEHLIRTYLQGGAPRQRQFSTENKLQVFVRGDGSGTPFRFCIDELNPAGHEVSPWITLDWVGWRVVEWNLSSGTTTGEWIGDGIISGQLRFDSFQLGYAGKEDFASGSIWLDDLRLVEILLDRVQPDGSNSLPKDYVLYQNFPNPFNGTTIIPYRLARPAKQVELSIYNSLGRKVASFTNLNSAPGMHQIVWGARNETGKIVSSGIYYFKLKVDGKISRRKMIFSK